MDISDFEAILNEFVNAKPGRRWKHKYCNQIEYYYGYEIVDKSQGKTRFFRSNDVVLYDEKAIRARLKLPENPQTIEIDGNKTAAAKLEQLYIADPILISSAITDMARDLVRYHPEMPESVTRVAQWYIDQATAKTVDRNGN